MKQGSCAEKDECSGATKLAFKAYRKGLELNKAMGVNFEKERVVLGGMRDKIRALLDKKVAKLNKLLAQIERIKAAMGDDDYDAAKKSLTEHLKIVSKSCRGMKAFAAGLKEKHAGHRDYKARIRTEAKAIFDDTGGGTDSDTCV